MATQKAAAKKKAAAKDEPAKEQELNLVPREEPSQEVMLQEQHRQQQLAIRQEEGMQMLGMIERLAANPEVDVDKMKQIMEMKEHMFMKEAEVEFNAAMARVQAQIEPVVANAQNEQTSSMYAKLDAIVKAISPIYTKEGFALSFDTDICASPELTEKGWFRIICEVSHSAGFSKKPHVDLPPDLAGIKGSVNKTPIHAYKSTLSYGKNMLVCNIFNVVTELEDDDGNAAGGGDGLSDKAADWIAVVDECATLQDLEKNYKEGYKDLDKDGYGRNQLMKAKDKAKERINNATA